VSEQDIIWSDIIFAFEYRHKQQIVERFGGLLHQRDVVVLGIPDEYRLMDAELVEEIQSQVEPFVAANDARDVDG